MKIVILGYKDQESRTVQLREFAAKRTWAILDEYIELQSGAGFACGSEFDRMLRAAREHKFDYLLRWSELDRIEMISSVEVLRRFESRVLEKLVGISIIRLAELRS